MNAKRQSNRMSLASVVSVSFLRFFSVRHSSADEGERREVGKEETGEWGRFVCSGCFCFSFRCRPVCVLSFLCAYFSSEGSGVGGIVYLHSWCIF